MKAILSTHDKTGLVEFAGALSKCGFELVSTGGTGAALAEGEDDPEGAILEALRSRLGPQVPIAISLDCHAGMTARMLDNVDVVTAYRTVPHVDLRRTGEQAATRSWRMRLAACSWTIPTLLYESR